MKTLSKRVLPAAAICLLIAAPVAFADEIPAGEVMVEPEAVPPPPPPLEDWYLRGFYLGLGGSYGWPDIDWAVDSVVADDILIKHNDEGSWGFNVRLGYRINDWFAVEGLYEWMDGFEDELQFERGTDRVRVQFGEVQTNAFHVNGKFIWPLGRFQPYAYGGVGLLNANFDGTCVSVTGDPCVAGESGDFVLGNDDSTQFAGRVGAGFDVFVTPHVAAYVDASYILPTGNLSDLRYYPINFGIKYVF